jgi:hypothetical protein
MGAPTSAILAESFIQCLEYTKIIKILNEHQIIVYHRYVYTLITYNTHHKRREQLNEIQHSTSTNKFHNRKRNTIN